VKHKIILVIGLLALGLFSFSFVLANTAQAGAALQPILQSQEMCPVSDQQLQEGMKAFEKMMPTFQHPRCLNCHGGVNPFEANSKHAGGKFDIVLAPEGYMMPETFGTCQNCHGGLEHWEIPEADTFFVGKNAVELCKQMKFMGDESFLQHIEHDRGKTPFIATAFEGTRALKGAGIEFYEALYDKKLVPEPPPISHATLLEQAKAWVDALGGEFPAEEGCGCEPQQYALQIDESFTAVIQGPKAKLDWNGSSQTIIPLKLNNDGTFTGETTSNRNMNVKLTAVVSCEATDTSEVKWQVSGKREMIEDPTVATGRIDKLFFSVRFTPSPGFVQCGMVQFPLPIDDTESADNPLKKVEMEALVGETTTVELRTSAAVSTPLHTFTLKIIKLE
jgi:hypothetical protein